MTDASFTAPPNRSIGQRLLDKNLKPYRRMSNIWKDRKRLQEMEADPQYIRNKMLATKGSKPRTGFGYNMAVNPGHKPGDSYVSLGYGGGVRDRFLGSLAAASMIASGSGVLSGANALKSIKGLNLARKWGMPLWTTAGLGLAADTKVSELSDFHNIKKGDIYKRLGKELLSVPMKADAARRQELLNLLTGNKYKVPRKPSLADAILYNAKDNPTERGAKHLALSEVLKNKYKEGNFGTGLKQFIQAGNPLVLGVNEARRFGSKYFNKLGTKAFTNKPINEIVEDIKSSQLFNSERAKDILKKGLINLETELPEGLGSALEGIDTKTLGNLRRFIPSQTGK